MVSIEGLLVWTVGIRPHRSLVSGRLPGNGGNQLFHRSPLGCVGTLRTDAETSKVQLPQKAMGASLVPRLTSLRDERQP